MAVRGIEPSYFAGMPTVQRDPRAGQPGEAYAAMPGQALSEVNALGERRRESDQSNAFRAREQSHREQQDATSSAREDRRLGMYQQGEDRRQSQQEFENDRLKSADTRKLVQAMQAALDDGEVGIAEAIAAELRGRGIQAKPLGAQAPAQPGAPRGPQPGPAGAPGAARPMSKADAATSAQLDEAEQRIIPKLRGGPTATPSPRAAAPRPSNQDVALSNQLDQIDKQYSAGLGVQPGNPKPLLPGGRRSPLRSRAIEADQLLSADDPLNRIVQ